MTQEVKNEKYIINIISQNIKELLDTYSMTIGDIVTKAQIPYSSVHSVVTGKTNPTIGTLSEIAKALNVEISQLLGETPLSTSNYTKYNQKVPIISWSETINYIKQPKNLNNNHEIFISSIHKMTDLCFGVHNTMQITNNFLPDSILFFDQTTKELATYDNQYVLIQSNHTVPLFRKLCVDQNNYFCEHPNKQIPVRKLSETERVVAWLFQIRSEFNLQI